jgi:hypothetical protein
MKGFSLIWWKWCETWCKTLFFCVATYWTQFIKTKSALDEINHNFFLFVITLENKILCFSNMIKNTIHIEDFNRVLEKC